MTIDDIDRDRAPGFSRPADQDKPSIALTGPLPKLVPFASMTPFETDGRTPNTFAIDPASIRLDQRYVMATIGVRSPRGADTIGYYGFDCESMQYRLLAYPGPDGQWQTSSRSAWQPVRDSETRNRQYRAVFDAGCRLGGVPAPSTEAMMQAMSLGREPNIY